MRFVSFFAGIGGFDLGLERAGHECVGQVEIDPYALRVLERHWPDVPRFGDVRTLDAGSLPDAELWCGGFPCQPFSVAGKRAGTDDERDLWPAWFRLIASRRPQWIFGENVPQLLVADEGRAWGRVVRDLASIGYVGEWTVLGAEYFNAPHKRERLWFVAADAGSLGPEIRHHGKPGRPLQGPRLDVSQCFWDRPFGGILGMDDGVSASMDRIASLGNAVVPQVVEAIARKVWG
jgi:DNA (cytosine-5)-methyltransferase 1